MASNVLLLNICYDYPTVTEGVFSGINKIWQPISLAYSMAMLRDAGIKARLVDANAERLEAKDSGRLAESHDLVFVSTSAYDRWECPHLDLEPAKVTCKAIRETHPKAIIILVGSHATVRAEHMLRMTGADAAIIGEPENAILEASKASDPLTAPGVAYLSDGGKLISNPPPGSVDIEALPLPDYSGLPMERYSFDMLGASFRVIETSRGCPFQCNFCLKKMFGGYRRKSIDKVKGEIRQLMDGHGVKNINFVDLEFTLEPNYVIKLCQWMEKEAPGIMWACQTRLDTVSAELLAHMKRAGCKLIMYGVESADQKMLDAVGKNITIEAIRDGIAATKKAGIDSLCFFMYGFPGDGPDDWERTVDFAIELSPDYASFFLCRPYPGTGCYDASKAIDEGVFPLGVGDHERLLMLKAFTDKAFSRFYFRPSFILRRILKGDFSLIIRQLRLFLHKRGWLEHA